MSYFPIYHEYDLDGTKNLCELPFGKAPVILYSKNQKSIDNLERYIQEKEITPHFPYPIYIVSDKPLLTQKINLLKSRSEAPKHFDQNPKKLTTAENKVFYQINMIAEKIRNTPVETRLNALTSRSEETKKLFMISRENQYYENILTAMKEQNE